MNLNDFDNKVLIIKDEAKEGFINLLSGKLLNIKLITLSNLKRNISLIMIIKLYITFVINIK